MKRIVLNSIVLPSSASHLLALRILKSYLEHMGLARHFDVRLDLHLTDMPAEVIVRRILNREPHIAAFSVYPWNVSKVEAICSLLKAGSRDIFIILGGPYCSHTAERWMASVPVDMIVRGAGEDALCRILDRFQRNSRDFSDICNLIYRKNGAVVETGKGPDFDVSRQGYPLSVHEGNYSIFYYETSRGCPFRCRYCTWSASLGKVRYYPREKIEKDLQAVFSLSHVRYLGLCDSDLFLKKKHGLWVLRYIRTLNTKRRAEEMAPVNLMFEINPQYLHEESIDEILRLPEGGNIISCGLQSEDEDVNRIHLQRPYKKKTYTQNLSRLFEKAKEVHLYDRIKKNITVEIIYGLPGETYEGFKNTIDFILSDLKVDNFICFPFEVLPGSYFWDHAEEYDLVYAKKPPHYLICSNTFSKEDMAKAERLVFFMYLFSTIFKGIMRFVDHKIPDRRLEVYEKIIDRISRNHPTFFSDLYRRYHHEDENETLLNMMKYQMDKKHSALRYEITRDARKIVKATAGRPEGNTG